MGWTFCASWKSREAVMFEVTGDGYNKTIARKLVGNHLWAVKEASNGDRYVALFLLEQNGGCWGYKDLDESMGPTAVDCPLRFLDLATAKPSGYANAWRERVREFHGKQRELALGAA